MLIAHLKGQEKAEGGLRQDGPPGRMDRLGRSQRGRLHPRAVDALLGVPHRESTARRTHPRRARPGRRGGPAGVFGIGRVCRIHAQGLPGARRRGLPSPPDHLQGSADVAVAVARLRARASAPCRGSRPKPRRSPPSRRSGSSAGFCPSGSTHGRSPSVSLARRCSKTVAFWSRAGTVPCPRSLQHRSEYGYDDQPQNSPLQARGAR